MLMQEIKKNFLKRRFYLVVFFLLAVKGIYGMEFSSATNGVSMRWEDNKAEYEKYLEKIKGKLTEQKKEFIEETIAEYNDVDSKIEELAIANYNGEISNEEYAKQSLLYADILNQRIEIVLLTSQYSYVEENPEQRYFIYQNGWINLMQSIKMDYLLVFVLILFITPVFCTEYETEMDIINRLSVGGKSKLFWYKALYGMGVTTIISALCFGENIIINGIKYGLPNGNYPIQSLHIFEDTTWNLSIIQVLLLAFFVQLIGAWILETLLIMISIFTKKALNTIIITICIIFLPLFLLNTTQLYALPFPTAFLDATGFIQGIFSEDTGKYEFISLNKIEAQLLIAIACICAAHVVSWYKYRGRLTWKCKSKLLLGICMLFLSGCGNESSKEEILFNCSDLNLFTVGTEFMVDATTMPFTVCGIENEFEENLIRDVFYTESEYDGLKVEYIQGDKVYYVEMNTENYDYVINSLDLENWQTNEIYSRNKYTLEGYDYLGINDKQLMSYELEKENEESLSEFWIDGNLLYLLEGDTIYCVNLKTGIKDNLIQGVYDENIAYSSGTIFYIDYNRKLNCYDVESGECSTVEEYMVQSCIALESGLIFQTISGEIYFYDRENQTAQLLEKSNGVMMDANTTYVYIVTNEKIIDVFDWKEKTIAKTVDCEERVMEIKSVSTGACMYVALEDGEKIKSERILMDE